MLHCVILCVIPIINFRNGHSTCTTVTIHDLSNGFLVLPLGGEVCVLPAGNGGGDLRAGEETILQF